MSLRGQKFAAIALASSGNAVAAVTGKRIRVIGWTLSAPAESVIKWQSKPSGAASDLTGEITIAAKGFLGDRAGGDDDEGCFETAVGEALYLTISAAVGGYISYVEI